MSHWRKVFSNVVTPHYLEQLAAADEHEVVHEVQEYFADYFAINSDLFSFGMPSSSCISTKVTLSYVSSVFTDRVPIGLILSNELPRLSSVFVFLFASGLPYLCSQSIVADFRPYIRAQKSSELATQVGRDLLVRPWFVSLFLFQALTKSHRDLFKFHVSEPAPILLIIDRRDDPVTPLLTQWTYQVSLFQCLWKCLCNLSRPWFMIWSEWTITWSTWRM